MSSSFVPGGSGSGPGTAPLVEVQALTAEQTRGLGAQLGRLLRAGDLVVLSGGLGAGKTTFAQGLGQSLGVRGSVTSPTFVISRVHPSLVGGPALVHVDAYRLQDGAELDDLDLDETLENAVTVVEWGDGLAEALSESLLRIRLRRQPGASDEGVPAGGNPADPGDEPRTITIEGVGPRWAGVPLSRLVG